MEMPADLLWQTVLGDLEHRISKSAFENWFRNTELVDFADDIAVISTPNTFSASTLQGRFSGEIEQGLSRVIGRPIRTRFVVATASGDTPEPASKPER